MTPEQQTAAFLKRQDAIERLENENMKLREAIKEAYASVNDVYLEADSYADGAPDAELYAKLSNNFAHQLKQVLTKLQLFLKP